MEKLYLRTNKQCVGWIFGPKCTNLATIGEPRLFICEDCNEKYKELNERLENKKSATFIEGEDKMVIYECYYQQKEVTRDECEKCYNKEMKDKYLRRAACVQDNAEKKDGSTF